jgi:hypothetical protein
MKRTSPEDNSDNSSSSNAQVPKLEINPDELHELIAAAEKKLAKSKAEQSQEPEPEDPVNVETTYADGIDVHRDNLDGFLRSKNILNTIKKSLKSLASNPFDTREYQASLILAFGQLVTLADHEELKNHWVEPLVTFVRDYATEMLFHIENKAKIGNPMKIRIKDDSIISEYQCRACRQYQQREGMCQYCLKTGYSFCDDCCEDSVSSRFECPHDANRGCTIDCFHCYACQITFADPCDLPDKSPMSRSVFQICSVDECRRLFHDNIICNDAGAQCLDCNLWFCSDCSIRHNKEHSRKDKDSLILNSNRTKQ